MADLKFHVCGILGRHTNSFYPETQALTSRITRRLWISSGKHEDFPLMAWPETSFSRPRLCSEDRRASRTATDQLGGPASRCRDYQTRFVTTRTLSLSRRARRKPARLDSPGLGRGRSGRPKLHPRPFDLRAQIAQPQVRNDGSSRRALIALRATRFPYPRVELQLKPAIDGLKRNLAATLLSCAQLHRLRQVCPDTKECGRDCSAARSQADPTPLPVDPASQPHRVAQDKQSPAPGDRSRSD